MAPPQKRRLDKYGRPLPTLAPAGQESRMGSEQNERVVRYVAHLLHTEWPDMQRAGRWGTIQITLRVENGYYQDGVDWQLGGHLNRLKER